MTIMTGQFPKSLTGAKTMKAPAKKLTLKKWEGSKADEKIDETTGVNKARGRMKAAILHRTKREPIKHKVMGRNFKFKSAFDVEPTLFEEMLIAAEQV